MNNFNLFSNKNKQNNFPPKPNKQTKAKKKQMIQGN